MCPAPPFTGHERRTARRSLPEIRGLRWGVGRERKDSDFFFVPYPLSVFVCLFCLKKFFLAYLHNFMNHCLISDAFSLARSRFPRPFLLILKVSLHCRRTGWLSEKLEETVAAAPFLIVAARWHPCST